MQASMDTPTFPVDMGHIDSPAPPVDLDQTRSPKLFLPFSIAAIILSIPVFVLSVFNFGLLSRWYNGALGIATFVFGLLFIFLRWRETKAFKAAMDDISSSDSGSMTKVEDPTEDGTKFPVPHALITLIPILILALGHFIAFIMMVDITIRGAIKSTLPAEREPGVTFPWNIKVQVAQTGVIGLQTVVTIVFLLLCYRGRADIAKTAETKREERDAGFEA